jgi:hypothetical protein
MRISRRLPLFIVVLVLLVAASVAALSYQQAREALVTETREKLDTVTQARAARLRDHFVTLHEDLLIQSDTQIVRHALKELKMGWGVLGDEATSRAQKAFITTNPHAVDERHKLDASGKLGAVHRSERDNLLRLHI